MEECSLVSNHTNFVSVNLLPKLLVKIQEKDGKVHFGESCVVFGNFWYPWIRFNISNKKESVAFLLSWISLHISKSKWYIAVLFWKLLTKESCHFLDCEYYALQKICTAKKSLMENFHFQFPTLHGLKCFKCFNSRIFSTTINQLNNKPIPLLIFDRSWYPWNAWACPAKSLLSNSTFFKCPLSTHIFLLLGYFQRF